MFEHIPADPTAVKALRGEFDALLQAASEADHPGYSELLIGELQYFAMGAEATDGADNIIAIPVGSKLNLSSETSPTLSKISSSINLVISAVDERAAGALKQGARNLDMVSLWDHIAEGGPSTEFDLEFESPVKDGDGLVGFYLLAGLGANGDTVVNHEMMRQNDPIDLLHEGEAEALRGMARIIGNERDVERLYTDQEEKGPDYETTHYHKSPANDRPLSETSAIYWPSSFKTRHVEYMQRFIEQLREEVAR